MPSGGRRPGAGRPKGSGGKPQKRTIAKEAAREAQRQQILAHMDPMTEAQIANAKGIKYLVAREKKTGKFKRMTEADAILKLGQESDSEIIEIWEKDPNVSAFTDLVNRAIDKPKEQPLEVDVTLRQMDERIKAARQRASTNHE